MVVRRSNARRPASRSVAKADLQIQDPNDRAQGPCASLDLDGIVLHVYYGYILRCADGTLYTGSTSDLAAREATHNAGRGAKYTAGRRPVRIVYSEEYESRSAAQSREYELKCWTRAQKEALIAANGPQHA